MYMVTTKEVFDRWVMSVGLVIHFSKEKNKEKRIKGTKEKRRKGLFLSAALSYLKTKKHLSVLFFNESFVIILQFLLLKGLLYKPLVHLYYNRKLLSNMILNTFIVASHNRLKIQNKGTHCVTCGISAFQKMKFSSVTASVCHNAFCLHNWLVVQHQQHAANQNGCFPS